MLSLMEYMRRKIMSRFISQHAYAQVWPHNLPSIVHNKLAKAVEQGRKLMVFWGGGVTYETLENYTKNNVVNMELRECDCRYWQISGIPCKHVACVILYLRRDPEGFVHNYFKKDAFMKTYSGIINPIPDRVMWSDVDCQLPLPLIKRNPIGRPKKLRRRGPDEHVIGTKTKCFVLRCEYCRATGHNVRSCNKKDN
ncbi:Transposase, MuDR, plant [Melia azedarach]|uniref:Transposase, MuDR, plant n=1 Tax=Melia azedarach TaxID=155640 RepID=A0ACC1YE70_MELAZ|nr:Transposase, MuDR, plant [Melia azedarach]